MPKFLQKSLQESEKECKKCRIRINTSLLNWSLYQLNTGFNVRKVTFKHNTKIQKVIDAFELMKYVCSNTEEEERTIEQCLDLFRKYFRSLWD